ncbi:MAG: HepT-like ribonuclease domain-containing protein [Syntrophales bacterium]
MHKDDAIRLRHMLDAARQAVQFTQGRKRGDLDRDPMLMLSLVKLVEIVGEAAGQVTNSGQAWVPDIPWADIVGMRHRLVHAYFDVNLDILWQTVRHDLPSLISILEKALDKGVY